MPEQAVDPPPTRWTWRSNGLYDGDVPVLWAARDVHGNLYLGVHEDHAAPIANVPVLLAELERLRETLQDVRKIALPLRGHAMWDLALSIVDRALFLIEGGR